jgi:ATP-dependent Clp protease ATP-binding subunit ClpX
MESVALRFDDEAVSAIARRSQARKTGARGLRAVVEETMLDIMFQIPGRRDVEEIVITRETVEDRKPPIYVLRSEPRKKKEA